MQHRESLKEHILKITVVSALSCLMMLFVTELIVPIQSYFLPELTLFAALIFPVHGLRVLCAWLCGWYSVIYLFIANFFISIIRVVRHDGSFHDLFSVEALAIGILVSVICIFTFDLLKMSGIDTKTTTGKINNHAWKLIVLVGFISSVFNSLGHNLIYTSSILPENSLRLIFIFLIGDTAGTVVCLIMLIYIFKLSSRYFNAGVER